MRKKESSLIIFGFIQHEFILILGPLNCSYLTGPT